MLKRFRLATRSALIFPFIILGMCLFASGVLVAQQEAQIPQINLSQNTKGNGGVITLSSRSEPVIGLSSWNVTGKATVVLYKADKEFLLRYLTHTADNEQVAQSFDVASMEEVTRFEENITQSGARMSLPLSESGIWYLQITTANGASNDAVVVRSSFGGVTKSMGDAYVVWAQDFNSWRSVSGVSVTSYDLTSQPTEIGSGVTNDDGVVNLPFSAKTDIVLLEKDGQVAMLPVNLKYFNSGYTYVRFEQIGDEYRYYLFTDRPIYKPGDTLYYKALLRQDDDARYSVPSGTAKVTLYRDWNDEDVVFEKSFTISAEGSLDGEFAIPEELSTGEYSLVVSALQDDTDSWSSNGRTMISVEEYRKPDYFLELHAATQEVSFGESASVKLQGSFFSGQPLTGESVSYSIESSELYQPKTLQGRDASLDSDHRYGYWFGDTISKGTVSLDATGFAEIPLPTEARGLRGTLNVLTVQAEFMDETGNPVVARKNILVYPGDWQIYRRDDGWVSGTVEKAYTIPVVLSPVSNNVSVAGVTVTAQGSRESWVKSDETNYYTRENETLETLTGVTNEKGELDFTFTPTKSGYYTFTVQTEAADQLVENTFGVWVSDTDGIWYSGTYSSGLTITTDKKTYAPGETARVAVVSEVPDRDVFIVLQRARVDRYAVLRLNGETGKTTFTLTDADMPNTFIRGYSFDANSLDTTRADISVSAEKKEIRVGLETDRTQYGPGDTVTLTVSTTSNTGQPVPAEVAVWTVDKALYELSSDKRLNIFKAFWNDRYESAQEAHSLELINFYSAEMGGCFVAGTQVLLADGSTKAIENVTIGDTVLTRASETDPTLVSAKVTGTHQANEAGYLIINTELRLTPNHILWVNDTWKTASEIQVDDRLLAPNGEIIPVTSIEWFAQKTPVYNLTVDTYQTYFADGYWVHNQKGGGVRSVLKDAAYWNPTVRTDAAGKAQLTFQLPDNLTTWVISGVAATTSTAVGESKTEIITQKDVVVRPVVPNILRVGDTAKVSALIHNYTDQLLDFTASLQYPDGMVRTATQSGVQIAGGGGSEQIFWEVQPTVANPQATAVFSAFATEESSDGIAQPLPVLPFGFTQQLSVAGYNSAELSLSLPDDTQDSYSTAILSLSPTMLGTLPTAMQYLLEYPYGCVEQTTSRFVPAVIAQQNKTLFSGMLGDTDLDKMIMQGITRLESLQNNDGGWGWYRSGVSDPFITAYVVEYVLQAQKTGAQVPESMLSRAEEYARSNSTAEEETILKLYALQLLAPTETVPSVKAHSGLTPDVLAYATLLNYRNGNTNPETNGVSVLLEKMQREGQVAYFTAGKGSWFGSKDASTALALRALILGGVEREQLIPLAQYLLQTRKATYWSNTFATAQVLAAITEFTVSGGDVGASFTYTVTAGDAVIEQGTVDPSMTTLEPITLTLDQVKAGPIAITKEGEGSLYSSLNVAAFRSNTAARAETAGIAVTRKYQPGKGTAYYPSVGDTVTVTLTLEGIPASSEYIVVEDSLPAGMIPINTSLENETTGRDSFYRGAYWYGESNETKLDGAIFLLKNLGQPRRTVSYQARVISEGVFHAPPASAADMYNSDIYGHTAASTIRVTAVPEKDPQKVAEAYIQQVQSLPGKIWRWIKKHRLALAGGLSLVAAVGTVVYIHKRDLQKDVEAEQEESQDHEQDTPH